MLPCQKQQLSIDLDFTRRHLHGTTVFQLDLTGFQPPATLVRLQLPEHAADVRLAARGCWQFDDDRQQSPWLQIPGDDGELKVQKAEDALLIDGEVIDALHDRLVRSKPTDIESKNITLFLELALEWQMSGDWLQPQSSAQHFIELPVHPRDAGGLSDGIGGTQCFESSVQMDFFLAGYVQRSLCWFPTLQTEGSEQRCGFEIDVSVPLGFAVCTAGRLVQRTQSQRASLRFRFVETCPLLPSDVALIVGPLDEAEEEGTMVMAPCGFPLHEILADVQKEKQSLVKTLDYPWPLLGCTVIFLPLPNLRPPPLPKANRPSVYDHARIHAGGLPCYSIHGSVYIFDLSLLGSVCPTLTISVIQPLRAYALATAWFGVLIRAVSSKDLWILHGLARCLADSALLQSWPPGPAAAEVSARLSQESQIWHSVVQNGFDLQILCEEDVTLLKAGSAAELLGAVRELKSYLVCHQLSQMLGWKAFHQQLTLLLQSFANRSISTSDFLEKMSEAEIEGRDLKAELSNFSKQWIYGLGCPEVHIGWFYNRSLHRLEFVASQTPLEPLALGDFDKSLAMEKSWQLTQPRVTKRGIGFGYSGFGEVTSEPLAAEAQLAKRCADCGVEEAPAAEGQKLVDEVPRKYWCGHLLIHILTTSGASIGQVELELRGTEPVFTTWLLPPEVQRGNEEELPQGLACLHVNPNRWPLAKLHVAQPPEFWQGVLEKSADPAAEAEAAQVLGDLAVAGKLGGILLHRAPEALSLPLKEPGWHEITCASCAVALCNWAAQLKKGDAKRSTLMRPVHHFLLEGDWRSDTGLARARMLVARSLIGAPKSLELWQNFLPKCRSLQVKSREDPVTLAAVELLLNSPRSASLCVSEALQRRLRLEEVLPSEHQRLAAAVLGTLSLLRLRLQAQDDPSPESFLAPSMATAASAPSSGSRKAWAKAMAVGSAPSSLEDRSKLERGLEASKLGHPWSRSVRYEACVGSYRGALQGTAFQALAAALKVEALPGNDRVGEILQEAIWTAEAMIRLPRGSLGTAKKKWDELELMMLSDSPKTWPLLRSVVQSLKAWKSRQGETKRVACKLQVMADPTEVVLWKTPGLYAKAHRESPTLRAALAAALWSHQAKGDSKAVKKLKFRKKGPGAVSTAEHG